jgi:hypothetical protein
MNNCTRCPLARCLIAPTSLTARAFRCTSASESSRRNGARLCLSDLCLLRWAKLRYRRNRSKLLADICRGLYSVQTHYWRCPPVWEPPLAWYGLWFSVHAFTKPVYGNAPSLFYYDQRIRIEGVDIEWMMHWAVMASDSKTPGGRVDGPTVTEPPRSPSLESREPPFPGVPQT